MSVRFFRTKPQAHNAAAGNWGRNLQFIRKSKKGWALYRYPAKKTKKGLRISGAKRVSRRKRSGRRRKR